MRSIKSAFSKEALSSSIKKFSTQRGLWLRALISWMIGFTFIIIDPNPTFDHRLKLRGKQKTTENVVLIHISQSEWIQLQGAKRNWIRPLKEITYLSDSFYWNPFLWKKILERALKEAPQKIAISFYFGDNIRKPPLTILESTTFKNNKVIWSARMDGEGRLLLPRFTDPYLNNVGLNRVIVDSDGVVRHFQTTKAQVPHLGVELAMIKEHDLPKQKSTAINFLGPKETYKTLSLTQFLNGYYPVNFLRNKVLIFGSKEAEGHTYRTPLGHMSRTEVLANITDNLMNKKWIRPIPSWASSFLLLLFLAIAIWLMSHYPQGVALVFLACLSAFWTTVSIWLFDAYYIWTPITSVLMLIGATFIIFLSFQLTLKDYMNIQLEKERKFLLEVEQLKNNFVSLISHDLKTPIAKIQAICDRLLTQSSDPELNKDLMTLRNEGSELHRYIKSILQITKVESRNFKLQKDAIDINEIVELTLKQMNTLAKERGITLDLDLEPMFLIEADQTLIHEVILNLLSNAIKYTPQGGNVTIITREIDNRIFVTVRDTGTGISEKEQSQIFNKFFRGKNAKMQPNGSGLGLYLVKYFIELHNGHVFIESKPGKGTKVGFSLPIEDESPVEENEII